MILIVQTIVGTLYQTEIGLYLSLQKVFYAWFFLIGDMIPFPGVRLILWVLFVNLLAAFIKRWPSWCKAWGLLITHLGLLLLFVAAFGKFHWGLDTHVTIKEGQKAHQSRAYANWELALWEQKDDVRQVRAIDLKDLIAHNEVFFEDHPGVVTPLRLELSLHYANALAYAKGPRMQDAAYRNGSGIIYIEAQALSKEKEENIPGILLNLIQTDEQKETLLLYGTEMKATPLKLFGRDFWIQLRHKRYGLPLSIELKDVIQELYPGTDTPSHYESQIIVDDAHVKRDVYISMNQPFRYDKYTFFQASYAVNTKGEELSTFTVSYNPVRLLPYVASLLVVLGLFLNFCAQLWRRRSSLMMTALVGLFVCQGALWAEEPLPQAAVDAWSRLPILEQGRVKPMESFAQNQLLQLSGRRTWNRSSASEWLLRLVMAAETMKDERVFRIDNPQVVESLGIKARKRRRYSFAELQNKENLLRTLVAKANDVSQNKRNALDRAYLQVWYNYWLYFDLTQSFMFTQESSWFRIDSHLQKTLGLDNRDEGGYSFYETFQNIDRLKTVVAGFIQKPQNEWSSEDKKAYNLAAHLFQWVQHQKTTPLKLVYVVGQSPAWLDVVDLLQKQVGARIISAPLAYLFQAYQAFHKQDWILFETQIKNLKFENILRWDNLSGMKRLSLERVYHRWDPMARTKVFYIILMCLCFILFLKPTAWFYRALVLLTVGTVIWHGLGIGLRMMILSRAPVSTLYETFIFVSWIASLTGLVMEWIQKKGLGLLVVSFLGFILMSIAGRYAMDGDTLEVLQAVLNSNFWLSTHVITITMGYSLCVVAGLIGHIYLIQATFLKKSTQSLASLSEILYGTLAAGLLFSFLGTILGGIWADQSWGRFWGWDPKENGALLIVLWCVTLFHARMCGMVKPWGFAAGCSLMPIFVTLAWFGINLLGVGLHSYGFTEGVASNLYAFIAFEVIFVGLMLVLQKRWNGVQS